MWGTGYGLRLRRNVPIARTVSSANARMAIPVIVVSRKALAVMDRLPVTVPLSSGTGCSSNEPSASVVVV